VGCVLGLFGGVYREAYAFRSPGLVARLAILPLQEDNLFEHSTDALRFVEHLFENLIFVFFKLLAAKNFCSEADGFKR